MSERKEKLLEEIREVVERIESGYRTKYYKEIPLASKKKVYNYLEKAFCEATKLVLEKRVEHYIFFSEVIKEKSKNPTIETIYSYIQKAIDEIVKFYNHDFAEKFDSLVYELKKYLEDNGYDVGNDFECLREKIYLVPLFISLSDKYPFLDELHESLTMFQCIDLTNSLKEKEIYELYGIKEILLELEEKISAIDTIDDKNSINIISEYINNRIDFTDLKND